MPLRPAVAARVHRVMGLRAFVDKDLSLATRAFAAARALEGTDTLPAAVAPPGHPVHEEYIGIDLATGQLDTLPPPREGALWFDGQQRSLRPTRWPTIAQWADPDASRTAYLWPGDPMFDYPVGPPPVGLPPPPPRGSGASTRRWIAPAATLAGAAVTYGAALGVATSFRRGDHDDEALARLRTGANGLVIASGLLAATGVGLGVAAAF